MKRYEQKIIVIVFIRTDCFK